MQPDELSYHAATKAADAAGDMRAAAMLRTVQRGRGMHTRAQGAACGQVPAATATPGAGLHEPRANQNIQAPSTAAGAHLDALISQVPHLLLLRLAQAS